MVLMGGWGRFSKNTRFVVGRDLSLRIRFWDNLWCGELPQGIGMHRRLNICVGTMGITHWDALYVRPLQDWELESVEVFFALLYSTMVGRNDEDKLVWLAACSGSFEVKLYYTVLLFDISWVMPK